MGESQSYGVQHLPFYGLQAGGNGIRYPGNFAFNIFQQLARTVDRITDNRMLNSGTMHPNLMRASGMQVQQK